MITFWRSRVSDVKPVSAHGFHCETREHFFDEDVSFLQRNKRQKIVHTHSMSSIIHIQVKSDFIYAGNVCKWPSHPQLNKINLTRRDSNPTVAGCEPTAAPAEPRATYPISIQEK